MPQREILARVSGGRGRVGAGPACTMGGQEQPNSFRCENDDKLFSQLFSSVRAALLENEASQTVVGPDVARSKSSANNRQNPTPSQPRQHNENKTGQAHFVGAGKGNGFVLDPHGMWWWWRCCCCVCKTADGGSIA